MILQAFREAGKALDAGELVCLFPEGQITRTGVMTPFQRGLERIVKGRDHADHPRASRPAEQQLLRPGQSAAAARADPVSGHGLVRRAAAAGRSPASDPPGDSRARSAKPGTTARPIAGRCIMSFIRQAQTTPAPAGIRRPDDAPGLVTSRPWPGSIAIARALRPRWNGQPNVGILLPASVGGRAWSTWPRRSPARPWSTSTSPPAAPAWTRRPRRPGSKRSSPAGRSSKRASSSRRRRPS